MNVGEYPCMTEGLRAHMKFVWAKKVSLPNDPLGTVGRNTMFGRGGISAEMKK
jgi:hypothetical protein